MITSSENRDSFHFLMPFIRYFCLIGLIRTSSTVFNVSGDSGHPSYVFMLRENIQTFTIKHDVSCRFFIDVPYQVKQVLFCS